MFNFSKNISKRRCPNSVSKPLGSLDFLLVRDITPDLHKRPGARFSKVPKTFRARKAIRKTPTCLLCKAGDFICCKGNKNKNTCKVSCLEKPSFWRYKENYVARKVWGLSRNRPQDRSNALLLDKVVLKSNQFFSSETNDSWVDNPWKTAFSVALLTILSIKHWLGGPSISACALIILFPSALCLMLVLGYAPKKNFSTY